MSALRLLAQEKVLESGIVLKELAGIIEDRCWYGQIAQTHCGWLGPGIRLLARGEPPGLAYGCRHWRLFDVRGLYIGDDVGVNASDLRPQTPIGLFEFLALDDNLEEKLFGLWQLRTLGKDHDMNFPAHASDNRLIVVSNRLPVSVEATPEGYRYRPSVGGLATSLNNLRGDREMLWVGWPGISVGTQEEESEIEAALRQDFNCAALFIPDDLFEPFYTGFSNGTLWPLFHYFTQFAHYDAVEWQAYQAVNELYLKKLEAIVQPGDRLWIHDYHLLLLPQLIREAFPDATIGLFLHIPFPSSEIFRIIPWREQILRGMLGSDLIGFHSFSYARHFLSSLLRILGLEQDFGSVVVGERPVKVDTFPLGVDVDRFSSAHRIDSVQSSLAELKRQSGDRKVILSVDRLDFTKGILQRLEAFELFLDEHPEWQSKVSLVYICVPSRTNVPEYQTLKRQVDELVGRINGRHSQPGWTPIWYLYRSFEFEGLVPFYLLADVALVTPIRDGMNLVAKEYLAARPDGTGVLILSETAGSAEELGEALIVNPYDKRSIIASIVRALEMTEDEQRRRNEHMLNRLKRYTIERWAEDFLGQLEHAVKARPSYRMTHLDRETEEELLAQYRSAERCLLLLDYDGTLVGFHGRAESARPDDALLSLLTQLAADEKNCVVVISGRDHVTLERWIGATGVDIVAEHGARFRRHPAEEWSLVEEGVSGNWQDQIRPVMDIYVDRTPGAYLEDKGTALVWHFRRAEPELGSLRAKELMETLESYVANTALHVMQGSKVIEVKQSSVNKGRAAQRWLADEPPYDFVLAIGDDVTDEDLFAALPQSGHSIKVRRAAQSKADYYISNSAEVRRFLARLRSK